MLSADESDQRRQHLVIFDTSLRDGEQSPGVSLNIDEKLEIAIQLSKLGVDVCEAGFPIASLGDFEAVRRIALEVGPMLEGRPNGVPMRICALARANEGDICRAFEAIKDAPLSRIHTFLATSDIHLKHKLKLTREECLEKAVGAVKLARSLVNDVEFSPEDAGRSDPQFLVHVLEQVIEAGATTLNIPDTVGYNTPDEYGKLIRFLIENTRGSDRVTWSTHCHNDLGLATANTLAGVMNGARQVEVTINGIGERAGNTSLEELVMVIYTHQHRIPVETSIQTRLLFPTSQLVSRLTGMPVQPNKAIVGSNAFAHESGIHQDGFLKCQQTYEIIHPSLVGVPQSQLILGKHSGRNAFKTHLTAMGYADLVQDKLRFERVFGKFKQVMDMQKSGKLSEAELTSVLERCIHESESAC